MRVSASERSEVAHLWTNADDLQPMAERDSAGSLLAVHDQSSWGPFGAALSGGTLQSNRLSTIYELPQAASSKQPDTVQVHPHPRFN